MYQPRHVLLTGGAGFIGSGLVRWLLRELPDVHIVDLDALTYAGSKSNLLGIDDSRHTFVEGNVCDVDLVAALFDEHSIDTVIHLAAESHVDRSIDDPSVFVRTNVLGTHVLLEAARRAWSDRFDLDPGRCRFHQVSTDEVFGCLDATGDPFSEESAFRPNSPYAASKAGADHLVRSYGVTYELPVTTTHGSNTYGPRQHAEKLIPTVLRACVQRKTIPVYGDGTNVRDWIHVDDHCGGITAAIRNGSPGESYNVGSERETSNNDLVGALCAIVDDRIPGGAPHSSLVEYVVDRPGHDWRYAVTCAKIRGDTGWQPQVAFDDGLERTVDWYLTDERWRSAAADGTLPGKRLGVIDDE